MSSAAALLLAPPVSADVGVVEPRIWTPPLRELTPETSYGFGACDFARDTLRHPFRPWQEWLVIHAGELLDDGRPRFREVLVIVARQRGKSTVVKVLVPFWQFAERRPMSVLTSTKLNYAYRTWRAAMRLAEAAAKRDDPDGRDMRALIPHTVRGKPDWIRETNGEQTSWTTDGCESAISAANEDCARSLTVDRLLHDELRQQHTYAAWEASEGATAAVPDAQTWMFSNAGDRRAIVLNEKRAEAIRFAETGEGDPRVGIFEWSASPGSDPTDRGALAQANPGATGQQLDDLVAKGRAAKRKGGKALTAFKLNYMCIPETSSDPAVDMAAWRAPASEGGCFEVGSLDAYRRRAAWVVEVAPDEKHVALVAAAVLDDGRVRVEPVRAWTGPGAVDAVRKDLPEMLAAAKVRPRALGWFPNSPAATLAAELKKRKGRVGWPPPGMAVEEIRGETAAACMSFASLIAAGQVVHSGDPMLEDHLGNAERLYRGSTWVFARKLPQGEDDDEDDGKKVVEVGHVTGAYGAAGAVHLARTMPTLLKPTSGIVTVD